MMPERFSTPSRTFCPASKPFSEPGRVVYMDHLVEVGF
jgi:hypothetical protein